MIGLTLKDVNQEKEYTPFPNSPTVIFIIGDIEPNGAYYQYQVCSNSEDDEELLTAIDFQNGSIQEKGINGCQIEDLLSICQHRLECFQTSKFACSENQEALDSIKIALAALCKRTEPQSIHNAEDQEEI